MEPPAEIRAQRGPQARFLACPADIAIYGGGAGAGKTYALLLEPLRYKATTGFGAVFFRRTVPQITNPGGLWDTACGIFPRIGGTGVRNVLEWRWPNGFKVAMRHLEREQEIHNWQGAQIPLICFDELTHFTQAQFTYMLSRCRSATGKPGRVRASCNANADSWVAKFLAWWIDQETGFARKDRAGVARWMGTEGGEIVWGRTREEVERRLGPHSALSVVFIPGDLKDNPALVQSDPGYLAKLRNLPNVERQRLEFSNWKIRHVKGQIFRREWFPFVNAAPTGNVTIRYWDRAGTPPDAEDKADTGPDWTVGVRMSMTPEKRFFIEDVRRLRGSPAEVEAAILNTAQSDGTAVFIGIEQDPGQAGKAEAQYQVRQLLGYDVRLFPATTSKLIRAAPFSAQCQAGNVSVVRAGWNDPYFEVLEGFPEHPKDDDVDASSGAFNALAGGLGHFVMA